MIYKDNEPGIRRFEGMGPEGFLQQVYSEAVRLYDDCQKVDELAFVVILKCYTASEELHFLYPIGYDRSAAATFPNKRLLHNKILGEARRQHAEHTRPFTDMDQRIVVVTAKLAADFRKLIASPKEGHK